MANLILITGAPATGKTTVSTSIGRRLRLPLIARDEIKEAILDSQGAKDRTESQKIGAASYAIMYRQISRFAEMGSSFIVESNFSRGRAEGELVLALKGTECQVVQIHCTASVEVISRRFVQRAQSEVRHKGHFDQEALPDVLDLIAKGIYLPLDVDGPLLIVDTTLPNSTVVDDVSLWLSTQGN